MFNVRDFGAVGDGVTDDTRAMQASLNAIHALGGGTLLLPLGTYKITRGLNVYSFTTILGFGVGSVIWQATAYTRGLILGNSTTEHGTDVYLKDFRLTGTYTHATSPNLSTAVYGAFNFTTGTPYIDRTNADSDWFGSRLTCDNLFIDTWGQNAVQLVPYGRMINCTVSHCWGEGILTGGDYCVVEGSSFEDIGSWAIDLNASQCRIVNNCLLNCGQAAAVAWDGGGIIITSNAGPTTGCNDNVIEGNILDTGDLHGILLFVGGVDYPVYRTLIANNIVRNVCQAEASLNSAGALYGAIEIHNDGRAAYPVQDTKVCDNTVQNVKGRAIELIDLKHALVSGNAIDGVTADFATGDAIRLHTHMGVDNVDVGVLNNRVSNFALSGVRVTAVAAERLRINGNAFRDPQGTADFSQVIYISNLSDFTCNDNFVIGSSHYDGIVIDGTTTQGTVAGNRTIECHHGISHVGTGDKLTIVDNSV